MYEPIILLINLCAYLLKYISIYLSANFCSLIKFKQESSGLSKGAFLFLELKHLFQNLFSNIFFDNSTACVKTFVLSPYFSVSDTLCNLGLFDF